MNFRLRFALLFTASVAAILFITSAATYILYQDYRTEDYYKRLRNEGQKLYAEYTQIKATNYSDVLRILNDLHNNVLTEEQLVMFDSNKIFLYKEPDTIHFIITDEFINKAQNNSDYKFRDTKQRQCIGFYLPEPKVYVFISAFDKVGLQRLLQMKYILSAVFIGGLCLTALMSFFFVNQLLKPLTMLSMQMQKTNALNLMERLPERGTNDELQQITSNFNKMLGRLNQTFQAQKSFVHNASHELRTPLATMLSQTEAALHKKFNETDFKKLLASLREEQLGLIELSNSLLLLSQYEKLPSFKDLPLLRIDEIIFDAIVTAKKIFPDAIVSFFFKDQPENENELLLPLNDALLKAAFTNLLKNAIIYSEDKKVFINYQRIGTEMRINFENKGKLIDVSDAENLMIPFFRGGNAIKIKGFGLGLSIVKRIVEIHNGKLTYNPTEPEINRFTVSFHSIK